MFHWSSNFLMLLRAIAVLAILPETIIHWDEHTCSSFAVCNNLETAQRCGSQEWCENQGTACESVNQLKNGAKSVFGSAVDTINSLCDHSFMAFKQPHNARKNVNIKFEVHEGQSPFNVRFHFDGHNISLSEHDEAKIAIRVNDKIIHDSLHNNTVSKNDEEQIDDHTCQSYFHVCNDFEIARQCESLAWCETQGAACGAVDLLRKGTPGLFGAAADAVDLLCENQFMAFRQPLKKFLKINFEMEDNQAPFTVRFAFDGSNFTLVENTEEKGDITINDKIVYDKYEIVPPSD